MKDSRSRKELPEECWELILNRLVAINDDEYGELKSPSLVCKQFLSITNRLRRKFVADNPVFYANECEVLLRALQRFPRLKEIDVYGRLYESSAQIDYIVGKIASSGLDLQALSFHFLKSGAPSGESFGKLGSTMKNLKIFRCRGSKPSLRDIDLVAIADALPWLEELDISKDWIQKPSNGNVTDAGIELISRKLVGLRKIDISCNDDCSDRSLISLSSNCVLLNEIRWSFCNVTEHGMFWVLSHCPNLTALHSRYCNPSPDLLFAVGDSKVCARALRVLDLRASENQDQILCSIAKGGIPLLEKLILSDGRGGLSLFGLSTLLCACPALKYLELWDISFLNDDLMGELCRYLPNVVSIKLMECPKLTNATFFILAKICPSLAEIVLYSIELEFGDEFLMDLERNDRITTLDLSLNLHLNDELLIKMGVICPNLRALDVRGCYQLTAEGIGKVLKCCSQIKHLKVGNRGQREVLLREFKTRHIEIYYDQEEDSD